ncbi:hypothetical protein LEP1GSC188_1318 [Leptospira weilii serovar Topaz str. LT2116]|uniref:Uncharacterized protein n=1 Tax=Leptospira weilii serovar Topaz str. LT2116 TaxID=1088540 RepID=M3FTB3_9LEPT|nr:hypothetical protein LEP1GSC188_1318 [Leptospira weilii serovar Topaz str. LT2116]
MDKRKCVRSRWDRICELQRRNFRIGRIGFLEDEQCHHQNIGSSPFTISWKQCHEFKRHFDPATGASISSDVAAPGNTHNLTHKYLDPKINLSEFRQSLCKTYAPQRAP